MKRSFFAAAMLVAMPVLAQAETTVGMADFTYTAAHHGTPVPAAIWYPSHTGGTVTRAAENAVFYGVDVRQDGSLAEGEALPVVLLSLIHI